MSLTSFHARRIDPPPLKELSPLASALNSDSDDDDDTSFIRTLGQRVLFNQWLELLGTHLSSGRFPSLAIVRLRPRGVNVSDNDEIWPKSMYVNRPFVRGRLLLIESHITRHPSASPAEMFQRIATGQFSLRNFVDVASPFSTIKATNVW